MYHRFETVVAGEHVEMSVTPNGEVEFTVNGCHGFWHVEPMVGAKILMALRKGLIQFVEAGVEFFWATAHEDEAYHERCEIYVACGFTEVSEGRFEASWDDLDLD